MTKLLFSEIDALKKKLRNLRWRIREDDNWNNHKDSLFYYTSLEDYESDQKEIEIITNILKTK